jgi:hypothetical protein
MYSGGLGWEEVIRMLNRHWTRQKGKYEIARMRLREKGYSEEEIDDMESAAGDREYHERKDEGLI